MVEWIEILNDRGISDSTIVSTLVVEWIEILSQSVIIKSIGVSTLVVEWIEIHSLPHTAGAGIRLHPRGGVD